MGIGSGPARRYADALFTIALDRGAIDPWQDELDRVATRLRDPTAMRALSRPIGDLTAKRDAIEALAGPLSREVRTLVSILLGRQRLHLVPVLAEAYRDRVRKHRGIEHAEVTTAVKLGAEDRGLIARRLAGYLGRQVEIEHRVDPDIIGGVVARVGDQLIDASLRARLEALRRRMQSTGP